MERTRERVDTEEEPKDKSKAEKRGQKGKKETEGGTQAETEEGESKKKKAKTTSSKPKKAHTNTRSRKYKTKTKTKPQQSIDYDSDTETKGDAQDANASKSSNSKPKPNLKEQTDAWCREGRQLGEHTVKHLISGGIVCDVVAASKVVAGVQADEEVAIKVPRCTNPETSETPKCCWDEADVKADAENLFNVHGEMDKHRYFGMVDVEGDADFQKDDSRWLTGKGFVYEKADGSLRGNIESGIPRPVKELCAFGFNIATAIEVLHGIDMIHNDIGTANVLGFDKPGSNTPIFKLADFGTATCSAFEHYTVAVDCDSGNARTPPEGKKCTSTSTRRTKTVVMKC